MVHTRQTPAAATVSPVLPPVPGWARGEPPVTDTDTGRAAAEACDLFLRWREYMRP